MKILSAAALPLSLVCALASCERQSYKETRAYTHHGETHADHGEHADHGKHHEEEAHPGGPELKEHAADGTEHKAEAPAAKTGKGEE